MLSVSEAYSMLLTHEARLESNHSNACKEAKMNYTTNLVQLEIIKGKGVIMLDRTIVAKEIGLGIM